MAICPSTLDAWLDWNAGEVSVFIAIEELSSDAKTAFTAPTLLKKNKLPELIFPDTLPFFLYLKRRCETKNARSHT